MLGLASVIYLAGFLSLYFSEPLFNSSGDPEKRLPRWQLLVWIFSAGSDELQHPFATLFNRFTHFDWAVERAPIILLASFVWILAIMLGSLVISSLVKRESVTRGEWIILSAGLGLGVLSCIVQVLGLAGVLDRYTFFVVAGVIISLWGLSFATRGRAMDVYEKRSSPRVSLQLAVLIPSGIVLGLALLSAMLPTPDYDAHAYHLLGPKEWFLAGRIQFLPHNVYTSFPFLTEMMHLVGMVAWGDWFYGGLVGQSILSGFGILTTAAVMCVGRRLFDENAGWLAALVYATAPWTYRLTSIPYVEGPMLAYGMLGLLCLTRFSQGHVVWSLMAGIFAGAAFGCKYPALLMVAVPLGAGVAVLSNRRTIPLHMIAFGGGFILLAGIWLVRNLAWTGNPVFPLLYDWMGATTWDAVRDERFVKGHQSSSFTFSLLGSFARDVFERSDWQSALVFAFAPWSLFSRRRVAFALWALIVYLFLMFFFTTHRLDRFFLTIEPVAALLAGAGMVVVMGWIGRWIPAIATALIVIFNISYVSTPLCGMNLYTDPLSSVRKVALDNVAPSLAALIDSDLVKNDQTVLFVGLAAVYESPYSSRYNTVFDSNILEQITRDPHTGGLRRADDIRSSLARHGINDIFVDWSWVKRYRSPGNYGYSDFITPSLFEELVKEGILRPIAPALLGQPDWQLYEVVTEAGKL